LTTPEAPLEGSRAPVSATAAGTLVWMAARKTVAVAVVAVAKAAVAPPISCMQTVPHMTYGGGYGLLGGYTANEPEVRG